MRLTPLSTRTKCPEVSAHLLDRQVEVVINFETSLHQLDQPAERQGVGTASDELWSARMAIAELTSKSGGRSSGLEPKGVEEHIVSAKKPTQSKF